MDLKLAGKRALVTGSSAGIGEAIAKLLAAEGAAIVVHGRSEERANAVARAIHADGGIVDVAIGDLATDAGADAVAQASGDVDILVNNAGTYHHITWLEATPLDWRDTYEANVVSSVRMIQRLVPQDARTTLGTRHPDWRRLGPAARIRAAALQCFPRSPSQSRGVLARDLKGSGVTSNVVAPGAIRVPSVEVLLRDAAPRFGWGDTWDEIERGAVRDMVPNDVGRLGRPEEIAAAVAYLASPFADYVSGATLRVDGGTIRSV